MARMTQEEKRKEFKSNFNAMNDYDEGRKAYSKTFAHQNKAENLLAAGGGEELGTLEQELKSLSAMNTIRESERKQAFGQTMLFDSDLQLGMRDASYIEATAEMKRRRSVKSHRWDKTRKKRMNTSRETLTKANDKIRELKTKLSPAGGGAGMRVLQRVEALRSIYDQIRIADRNCAEAIALSKSEEKKLKDKAELTYCKSIMRMLDREMDLNDHNHVEYDKLQGMYELNLRVYNELMASAGQQHQQQQQQHHQQHHQQQQQQNQNQQPGLMDEKAEELVTSNVKVFRKYCTTLNDRKYGTAGQLWNLMKSRASNLLNGWEHKSDLQRGDALGELLISANRLLCKEGRKNDTDKARETVAKQFRSFFKSVLESMSQNCRVLALERIFQKVDELNGNPDTPETLKKANESIFTELARERYRKDHPDLSEKDDALKIIDGLHYRFAYAEEKEKMHHNNVIKVFGGTKEFMLANLKFDLTRFMSENMIADDFRLDRFGNVIEEDVQKKEQWKKLIQDIADANQEKALKIQRGFFARIAARPFDPEWITEDGYKKHIYEVTGFSRKITSMQNYGTSWKEYNEENVKKEIRNWNREHPQDQIPEENIKDSGISCDALIKQRELLEKLPSVRSRAELQNDLDNSYVSSIKDAKGIFHVGGNMKIQKPVLLRNLYNIREFLKDPGKTCSYDDESDVQLVHQDGTEFEEAQDVDNRRRYVHNAANPLMYKHDKVQSSLYDRAKKQKTIGYLNGEEKHGNVMKRVEARISLVTELEADAMRRLKALTGDKGDPAELAAIEKLNKDYLAELNVQAVAAETLFQAEVDSVIDEHTSGYYTEALKYYKQKEKINSLFDRLEKAREDFITANAGKESFVYWKKELEEKRKQSRGKLLQIETENTTAFERVKKAFALNQAVLSTDDFTDEEYERIKQNNPNPAGKWGTEQRTRVLSTFILTVNRDFSGAYVSDLDRYNADFNKRFKKAMTEGEQEEIRNLSREFTQKTLPRVSYVDPEGLEKIDAEGLEQRYISTGNIRYRNIKNTMIGNVQDSSNTDFPLLKTGLEEFKGNDPGRYKLMKDKLDLNDDYVINCIMYANGYDTRRLIPEPSQILRDDYKAAIPGEVSEMKEKVRQIREQERLMQEEERKRQEEEERRQEKLLREEEESKKQEQLKKEEEEKLAEEAHKQREKELEDKKDEITAKSGEMAKALDDEESRRRERLFLTGLLESYEALDSKQASLEDAYALRERMVNTLKKLTGADDQIIEFTPADRLAGFIRDALEIFDAQDKKGKRSALEEKEDEKKAYLKKREERIKKLAADIKETDKSFQDQKIEEGLVKRAAELLKKKEGMTALDRLLLYDHNALLIAMNRNSPDDKDDERLHYNDFKSVEPAVLTRYARQSSMLGTAYAKKDEDYESFTAERAEKLSYIAKEILSEYTGKEKAYFDVLSLEELSSYAFDIHDLLDKNASEKAKKDCLARVEKLNKRISLLDGAVKSFDKEKIAAAVSELTGIKAEEMGGMLTVDLFEMANSLTRIIGDDKQMKEGVNNAIGLSAKLNTPEQLKYRFHEAYDFVQDQENAFGEADERSWKIWKEFAVRYLPDRLGLSELTQEDYKDVDPRQLRLLMECTDVIRAYRETPPKDETQQDDLNMAIRSFARGCAGLSDRAKKSYEKVLSINLQELPKVKAFESNTKQQFSEVRTRDFKPDISLDPLRYIEDEQMMRSRKLFWHKKFVQKSKAKAAEKAEKGSQPGYSKEALMTKEMFAQLITALSDSALDSGLSERVKKVLLENAEVLGFLAADNKEKGNGYGQIFTELKVGAAGHEKRFMALCEDSLSDIMRSIDRFKKAGKEEFSPKTLNKLIKSGKLNTDIGGLAGKLPGIVNALEEDVIPVMENSVRAAFGQGGEEDIRIMKTFIDTDLNDVEVDAQTKKDLEKELEKTVTIKKMKKLNEKSEAQRSKERAKLDEMESEIRFDTGHGQGKFIQLLISNYYRDASESAKRRMLSYIIRDMNRETAVKTEKETGCSYFASIVKGAGPIMQKMMQGVPERMVINEMAEALNVVKSSLPSIDKAYVDKVFKDMIDDSQKGKKKIKRIADRRSLGAASVAETFECTVTDIKGEDRKAVVKILRPDAVERMKEELNFIKRSAMYADMTDDEIKAYEEAYGKTYNPKNHTVRVTESGFLAQYSEIVKEFDFTNEVKNCNTGYTRYVSNYYDKKKGHPRHVNSVVIDKKLPQKENYFIMDKAEGETVDKIIMKARESRTGALKTFQNDKKNISGDPQVLNADNVKYFWKNRKDMYLQMSRSYSAAKLLENLTYVWLDQAMFGAGLFEKYFHHGDMHAGNIMIDLEKDQSTVIDYGNSVLLDTDRVKAIINMMLAVVVKRADIFVQYFNNMLKFSAKDEAKSKEKVGYAPMSEKTKAEFMKRLDDILTLGSERDSGKKILVALNIAQELGVKLPREIQNFSQCQQRLENTLSDVRNETIRLCEGIDLLDNLQVADEDKDSIDPLIRLHDYRQKERMSGAQDSKKLIEDFAKSYSLTDIAFTTSEIGRIGNAEEAYDAINKYFQSYRGLKEGFDPKKTVAAAVYLLKAFEQVIEFQEAGKTVPKNCADAMEKAKKEIADMAYDNNTLKSMADGYDLNEAVTKLWDNGLTDRRSFERVYYLFKRQIPSVIAAGDAILKLGDFKAQNKNNRDEELNLRYDMGEAVITAIEEENMAKTSSVELLYTLHTKDRDEFERQAGRVNNLNNNVRKKYNEYRKSEKALEDAKKSGDENTAAECREKLEAAEKAYVLTVIDNSGFEIKNVAKQFYENEDVNWIKGETGLKDFSSVMGEVLTDKIINACVFKLDTSLTLELGEIKALKEKEEKAIIAQEAVLANGEEPVIKDSEKPSEKVKEAIKIKKEYEEALKEMAETRKKRTQEIRRKVEEAVWKEEEAERRAKEKAEKKNKK